MLYFILAWTALILVSGVLGIALLQWFKADCFGRVGDRLIAAEWLGMVFLSINLLAVSLFVSLTPFVGTTVALILCTIALGKRAVRLELTKLTQQLSWQHCLGYSALVVVIATFTVRPVTWIDSGLYHFGMIQWLAQYGTVTGVTLLFSNLGFTSSWFALAAPFNPPFLDARVSAVANGFVLVVTVLQFGIYLAHNLRGRARASDRFGIAFFGLMLLAVVLYRLLRDIAISPSPDLPITFLVGVIPWAMLVIANAPVANPGESSAEKSNAEKSSIKNLPESASANNQAVPLLLAVGAMSIKLTAIPLVLVSSLFYMVYSRRSLRQLVLGGAIGLVLLTPLLLAGIKASGCPLYPSSIFCLDVPWRPPATALSLASKGTHGWTSWYGTPPPEQNPWLWAAGKWLQAERTNQATVGLIGINIIALIGSVNLLRHSQIRGKRWVMAISGAGIVFLLTTAPFFRFVLPYLLLIPCLLVVLWIVPLQRFMSRHNIGLQRLSWINRRRTTGIVACVVITASLAVFAHSHPALHLLLPPPMQTVPVVQKQVNDVVYFSPQNKGELCWAASLPCGFEVKSVKLQDPDRGLAGGLVRTD